MLLQWIYDTVGYVFTLFTQHTTIEQPSVQIQCFRRNGTLVYSNQRTITPDTTETVTIPNIDYRLPPQNFMSLDGTVVVQYEHTITLTQFEFIKKISCLFNYQPKLQAISSTQLLFNDILQKEYGVSIGLYTLFPQQQILVYHPPTVSTSKTNEGDVEL